MVFSTGHLGDGCKKKYREAFAHNIDHRIIQSCRLQEEKKCASRVERASGTYDSVKIGRKDHPSLDPFIDIDPRTTDNKFTTVIDDSSIKSGTKYFK